MAGAETNVKKIEKLTAKYIKQSNEDLPKKLSVFHNQAIILLGIFDSIIDAAIDENAEPPNYATWEPEKINTEIFRSYSKIRPKVARLPNRMSAINKASKAYSEDCEKVSQWYREWEANKDFVGLNMNTNELKSARDGITKLTTLMESYMQIGTTIQSIVSKLDHLAAEEKERIAAARRPDVPDGARARAEDYDADLRRPGAGWKFPSYPPPQLAATMDPPSLLDWQIGICE